jgi:hypothetical protein
MRRVSNALITGVVIAWTLLFHYESLRAHYLTPLLQRELPKFPLLFPPAGWIMFYQIEPAYGFAEVYGLRGTSRERIDPHAIFSTRAVGYDNIHRNVLVGVLSPSAVATPEQCRQAKQRRPREYDMAVLLGLCRNPADEPVAALPFCRYLQRKFPQYDRFLVAYSAYPDLLSAPTQTAAQLAYACDGAPPP